MCFFFFFLSFVLLDVLSQAAPSSCQGEAAEDPSPALCRARGICIYHCAVCLDPAEGAPYLSHPLSKGCNNLQALTDTQDTNTSACKRRVRHPGLSPAGALLRPAPGRCMWIVHLWFEAEDFIAFSMLVKYTLRFACALSFSLAGKYEKQGLRV